MNHPTPNQLLVLGLAIGFPPWILSLFSGFATGGVVVGTGFGLFAGNAVLALTVAYYAETDSRPMSGSTRVLLGLLGFFVVFAFVYSILLLGRPLVGFGILVTLGPLFAVYYAFRRRPADADSARFEETEWVSEDSESAESESSE
ncbi:hypothetical protein [Haladaptatus sp. NG-WS-4]